MAFPLVITNSSCDSMKNRHTSIFHFSDTLTYLITHSITQLGMVVGKKYITPKRETCQFETFGHFESLHISSLLLVIIIKRKLSISRD